MSLMRDYTNPKPPLRAKGNLSYLQFIELVKKIWSEAHPKIPLVTSGADDPAQYPCIIYSLQLRKTHPNEPKMRYREEKNNQEDVFVVGGQRFQNIIYFQAIGEAQNVDTVEHLIEIFEDFMIEFTPVFKELGVSELVYARRLSDTEQQRPGANTVARTVSYMVTTEKVVSTRYDRLKEIVITARTWLEDLRDYYEPGTIYDNSPRYHLTGPNAVLSYKLDMEADTNSGAADFEDLVFIIPRTYFRIGDILYLAGFTPMNEEPVDTDKIHPSGFFEVSNITGNPYDVDVGYTLTRRGANDSDAISNIADISQIQSGYGVAFFVPQWNQEIIDEFKGVIDEAATPNS